MIRLLLYLHVYMYMYVCILYFSTDLRQDLKYGTYGCMDAFMYVCMYINHVQDILQEFTYIYCMYA